MESNRERLETVGAFMDVVLDYFEDCGIPHDHDDLCCYLSERFEDLLTRYGALKGE